MLQGPLLLVALAAAVAFVIVATTRFKVHAFLALLLAATGVGLAVGMAPAAVVEALKEGSGGTLAAIGIVILLGTILGVVLERTGSALCIASAFLRLAGAHRSPLAMSLTGYVVGIPIFCDSGFVVLSPLNRSIAAQSKTSMAVMAVALALPLFVIHCLIPPHPGPAAAAGILHADVGLVMLLGFAVGIPAVVATLVFALRYASRFDAMAPDAPSGDDRVEEMGALPPLGMAVLPLLLPLLLIAGGALAAFAGRDAVAWTAVVRFLGDPTIALAVGVLVALALVPRDRRPLIPEWLSDGVVAAGPILAITGAGGAFGGMLRATPVGEYLGELLLAANLGLFLPFLLAAALKTAQGSSTVAVLTAASLMSPLLPDLGLDSTWGVVMVMLALGAGSMVLSHANDSYFWVVSRFSGLDDATAYRTHTLATVLAGCVTMLVVFAVSLVVL